MSSAKQVALESSREWYPYYAGFREAFVDCVLTDFVGKSKGAVLDPWNGAGTTTAACSKRGIPSLGVDINPALTVIARARVASLPHPPRLLEQAAEMLSIAKQDTTRPSEDDALAVWFKPGSVARIRSLQLAIKRIVAGVDGSARAEHESALPADLSAEACYFYSVLFAAVRDLLRDFRATNPTWIKKPSGDKMRLSVSWREVGQHLLARAEYLAERLPKMRFGIDQVDPRIITASALCLPTRKGEFAAAVTSPPYATRIDYVTSTLPELAVLGLSASEIKSLRKKTTGTPVVTGRSEENEESCSATAKTLLWDIARHPTKGSRGYYYPWMQAYLLALQKGLRETARSVKRSGPICVVVQDSHYKELRVDLQAIVIEMLESASRKLVKRIDYEVRKHRAQMNTRSRAHLVSRRTVESLLVFS